ncbi:MULTISPECIES: GOLPH3/VPS74 family protein [Micromonospora]|uniref:GPP34 family phosphoprotein n=1 Tax=Micromonospora robiginosa TaxID=2749844 RepID=A0A7L6B4I5_9ACTN|nr:GPP34 family phosphoprotein [Micromonospora ferruginea]QLQ36829.1 GPP34 family phosphoprotein [Micromonospora ferruginea]
MTYPGAQATYRLADALFLIGHDEFTGKPHVAVDRLECGLAGAALAELMFEGRIALDNGGIAAVDPRLWQEPLTDLLITEILRREGAHPARLWIRYLRTQLNINERVGTRLVTAGVLRREQGKLIGRQVRWPAIDPNQAASPRVRLTAMLMHSSPAELDPGTLLLASLGEAVGLAAHIFDPQVGGRMRDCRRFLPAQLEGLLAAVVGALDVSTTTVRR